MSKQNQKIQSTEKKVLDIYQTVLPSVLYSDKEGYETLMQKMEHRFRFGLNFPPEMFSGRKLIDLGAGTGDRGVFYKKWGAHCTLVDMNSLALKRAKEIFTQYAGRTDDTNFIESSIFDLDIKQKFDIVISDGVFHHTEDKKRCFDISASMLNRSGYYYLGIGNAAGMFQRNLQRAILNLFANSNDDFIELTERLFPEHLERAMKYGSRSKEAIVFDTYINPKIDSPSASDVMTWFKEHGIQLYSSYPRLNVPFLYDGIANETFMSTITDPRICTLPELHMMTHNIGDTKVTDDYFKLIHPFEHGVKQLSKGMNDITSNLQIDFEELADEANTLASTIRIQGAFTKDTSFIEKFFWELQTILTKFESKSLEQFETEIKGCQSLFRGTLGVGMNYYIGYKP